MSVIKFNGIDIQNISKINTVGIQNITRFYPALTEEADSEKTLWTWGRNNYGQLGDGSTTDHSSPVQIGSDTDWSQVTGGDSHSLSLKSNGTLWTWGRNNYGQLGDGSTTNHSSPVQIGSLTDWDQVTGGYQHSLALRSS